jgi:DNA mismatch endonuclease (patch repair protein)
MDNLSKEDRRKTMQHIRSKGTKIEETISKALWKKGVRFRRHQKDLPGKPDFSIKKYKLAVFLDSCFFHGCPEHAVIPKTNTEYWTAKMERNQKRDRKVNEMYKEMDWTVLRFWEHEVKKNKDDVVNTIVNAIKKKSELFKCTCKENERWHTNALGGNILLTD